LFGLAEKVACVAEGGMAQWNVFRKANRKVSWWMQATICEPLNHLGLLVEIFCLLFVNIDEIKASLIFKVKHCQ
jgi:hypothetical protein